ncbi:terminase small subunit [Litorimonas haliclonae]|uniref:terminase small subunit n=1 Tax=Litorimonas haliclonae TaxID=2081977 RepID=UPI0039EFB399
MAKTKKLTPKQKLFVAEYLIDLNATQAAIRAGYSEKTAYSQGQRLLKNVEIQNSLAIAKEKRADRLEITADRIAQEYAKLAFSNMENYIQITSDGEPYVDLSELTSDQAAAISEVSVEDFTDGRGEDARDVRKVRFKLHDKKSALDSLGKHIGFFEKDNGQKGFTVVIDGKAAKF